MKILYYSSHPNMSLKGHGGYSTHMREIINAFEKLGHSVFPVIMGDLDDNTRQIPVSKKVGNSALKDIIKTLTPKLIWRSIKDLEITRYDDHAAKTLENKIQEIKPDLIYERVAFMQTSGVRIAKKFNIKHFMELNAPTVDEVYSLEGTTSLVRKKAYLLEKFQLENSDQLFPVSKSLSGYFSEKYGINKKKFTVIPNAINQEKTEISKQLKEQIVEKYDLNGKKVIGFVGSIFSWHRVDILIDAFDEIDHPNTKLLIVGDSSDKNLFSQLKARAAKKASYENIVFTGRVPHHEVFTYISVMNICVSPNNLWYMSPIKIFEYGAMGKPIIAPNIGPVNEVIQHQVDGLVVDPSSQNIKNAITRILNDEAFSRLLASNIKSKILMNYTWKNNAERILHKY